MIDLYALPYSEFASIKSQCRDLEEIFTTKYLNPLIPQLHEHMNSCEVCIAAAVAERMNRTTRK